MERTHSFGYWLKRRRKALDLTQAELAQRVSCSLDLIQKIEADVRRPSRQLAEKLAQCLGLPVDEWAGFVQAARAERAVDQLALPSQPVDQPLVALPQGTLTFLFTDIEGSSRLWEQFPRAMPAALARHDTLLRGIVGGTEGVMVKNTGDGMMAAFASAPDALVAALNAQRTLLQEDWGTPTPLRVRMALHSGSAELREGDYFGPALNRAARLLHAGHGGQVLLSLATEQLVREHMPPDVALRDLGMHRLKDLSLLEQIFQLVAPNLPADFPALNTIDARRTNLPAQLTALIGRESEVATICTLLQRADVRLVTLTGPGGVGKTRLSLQIAAELIEEFTDGVYFVDLAPIREASLVTSAIAVTLGVRESAGQPLLAILKEYLRDKRMLLLLDNFEQVVQAAPLVAELLAVAPKLNVLVTSRERLKIRGEKEVAVTPLALPDQSCLPPLDQLSQYGAVALFIERALDAEADFQVTNANAPAVAEICAQLDGLPLAIELAAARVKLFAPEALLARLSSRLAVLSSGPRDLPARQQTIRSTIAWSYDLLSNDEQTLFRRLGVFIGGCTLESAEAVCADPEIKMEEGGGRKKSRSRLLLSQSSIFDGLAALVDKSLLQQREGSDGVMRFTMLETIREFALERLEANGETEELRRRHAKYYFAYAATQQARGYETHTQYVQELFSEYDNLRAVLAWSQTTAGDPEMALRLAAIAVEGNLVATGYEGIRALQRSLGHPRGVGRTSEHLYARIKLAEVLGITGDYASAQQHYILALALAQELGETNLHAVSLFGLGWLARERGDTARAWTSFSEALALFRIVDNTTCIPASLNSLAEVAIMEEDPDRAEALLAESQKIAWDTEGVGWALNHLGHAAQLRGQFARAAELHRESLAVFGEEYMGGLAEAYQCLGECALGLGRIEEGVSWLTEGLRLSNTIGHASCTTWCLSSLGTAAALADQPEWAARLWGAAEQLREAIGCRPAPATRATYERALTAARAQLSEQFFVAAWTVGRAMTLEQAIAYALEEADPPAERPPRAG